MADKTIDVLMEEERKFPPPKAFSKKAHIKSLKQYKELYKNPLKILTPSGQRWQRNFFIGIKSGQRYLNGTLPNRLLNGLSMEN